MIKGEYMTRFFNSTFKTKLIVLLTVLCLLFSCVGLYACGDDEEVTDPSYDASEEADDVLIKNSSFAVGTYNVDLTNFPVTTPNGWSKAQTDNSSSSSAVNSGVVDTDNESWNTLLETLYSDSDFVSYLKNIYGYTQNDLLEGVRAEKGDPEYDANDEELNAYAIKTYVNITDKATFTNPGTSPEGNDDYIYMLNNIGKTTNYQLGLAQKITSSSSVTLEPGKVYGVSVWVKTANLDGQGEIGANIRLSNTFDSKSQAEYRISNIVANDWTKYTIYVKTDVEYAGTFTLVLGLGYGNGNANASDYYTEGTAYFDDITITEVDAEDFTETLTADNMVFGGEDEIEASIVKKADKHFISLYDMTFANSEANYFETLTSPTVTSAFTTSNITVDDGKGNQVPLTSAIKVGKDSTQTLTAKDGEYTVEVNKASATLTVKDKEGANFSLANEEYALISFEVKNELVAPAVTSVYVDVIDVYGNTILKNAATFTVDTTDGEFTRHFLLVKNNFTFGDIREFYINFVVGPNDVASLVYDSDFSTGSVTIKNVKIAKDSLNDDLAKEEFENVFDFLSDKASATVALHAGYENDFTEESEAANYDFSTRPGNFGDIMFGPTNVEGYTGIVPNHSYITSDVNAETYVDTRSASGKDYDVDGIAGLINTKYLSNYKYGAEIKSKLGFEDGDDDAQLVMINNKNAGHYGFVGNKINVSTSGYGKVSVTLKVCDQATAYVYLVDVSGSNKNVLSFNDFTVNTDVVAGVAKGTEVDGDTLRYELKVTSDMMDADGFVTVNFYVAAGATAKSYRVEVWNGSRDGNAETASKGYVFVKSIESSNANGFTEGSAWNSSFSVAGNPLYEHYKASFNTLYAFERQLTETEIQYNKEYPDSEISYSANYVWAKSNTVVYGVFNTVDPVITDPYDDIEDEEEESGCTAETDPSTFWLSFSSILLATVLVAAIVVLIVKRSVAKRRANRSDALSHYKVTSRIRTVNKPVEEVEEPENTEEEKEETSDEYVYGDVQAFGDEKDEK